MISRSIGRRRLTGLALGLAVLATRAPVARADLTIQAPTVSVTPGSTGTFDVVITDTGATSFDVAFFALELNLLGAPAGIQFTDATTGTADPYVFVTSTDDMLGVPLSITPFPNQGFTAIDTESAPPGARTINPGDTFGLAHVSYSVAPGTPAGSWTLQIGPGTSLLDAAGAPVPFTPADGRFSVVPEPSALAILAIGGTILLGGSIRSRRARRTA